MSFPEILLDDVLPAMIVAAGLAACWFRRGSSRETVNGRWGGSLIVSAAFVVAMIGIGGAPRQWPGSGDASFYFIWFAPVIALVGLWDALYQPADWLRAALVFVLARIALRLLLAPLVATASAWMMETWIDVFSGCLPLWWLAIERQSDRTPAWVLPANLLVMAAGVTAIFALSSNVKMAQASASLAGMSVACTMAAALLKHLSLGRGAALALIVPLALMFPFTDFYSYTPPPRTALLLLAVAPLMAWTAELPPLRRHPRTARLLQLVPAIACVVLAAVVTWHAAQIQAAPGGAGEY